MDIIEKYLNANINEVGIKKIILKYLSNKNADKIAKYNEKVTYTYQNRMGVTYHKFIKDDNKNYDKEYVYSYKYNNKYVDTLNVKRWKKTLYNNDICFYQSHPIVKLKSKLVWNQVLDKNDKIMFKTITMHNFCMWNKQSSFYKDYSKKIVIKKSKCKPNKTKIIYNMLGIILILYLFKKYSCKN